MAGTYEMCRLGYIIEFRVFGTAHKQRAAELIFDNPFISGFQPCVKRLKA
jgi:hypothetical protein